MFRYVVRVWLPDRPGALGQIASRIGAVRGDVIGIEILERGAGRAVDELVVALPELDLVDLLVAEMMQVDGVDVENVRLLDGEPHEPELDALAAAARVVEADATAWVLALVAEAAKLLDADWAVALAGEPLVVVASAGSVPDVGWLGAFVAGARHLPGDMDVGPDDLAWTVTELPGIIAGGGQGASGVVALGRQHRPLRWRERRTLALLVRVAAAAFRQPAGSAQSLERSTARRQPA